MRSTVPNSFGTFTDAPGGSSSVGRAAAFQAACREFEPRLPLQTLRVVLQERLGGARVRKEGRQLVGSTLTFNPDLVFDGGSAVGDVKYKMSGGDWSRADLYQTIAFAEAFGANRGLIIRFRGPGVRDAPDLWVGAKAIHEVTWRADSLTSSSEAADAMATDVLSWLDSGRLSLSA